MRLVEAVAGELVDQVEDLVALLLGDVVDLLAAVDEQLALVLHLLGLLLAHRPAHEVGAAEREAGQLLRGHHDLLLVDEHAVGLAEDVLEQRVRVLDLAPAVLALDELVDHAALERARAVQRHGGDDVLEHVGLELLQQLLEPRGFELEHASGLAARDHVVDPGVVHRDPIDVERALQLRGRVEAPGLRQAVDLVDRVLDDRQGLQAEEVELDQPGRLDVGHRVLGDDLVVGLEAGHVLGQLAVADHDPGRVHARVAVEALERAADLDDLADLGIELGPLAQLGRGLGDLQLALELAGLIRVGLHLGPDLLGVEHAQRERDLGALGDQLGQLVGLGRRLLHHPADVAEQAAGLEAVEGRDLPDPLDAVVLGHVADHLLAPIHAEVDVEVGHRHALGVQEALEQEVVLERIDVGDPHAVGDQAAGTRAAPGPDRDPDLLGVGDEVPDDQEVARELHVDDDLQLALESLAVQILVGLAAQGSELGEALLQALASDLADVLDLVDAVGELEVGQLGLAELELDVAHLRDPAGVLERLGVAREVAPHLVGGLDEELGAVVLEPLLVVDGPAHAHAHQDLVGVGLGPVDVVAVVGRYGRDPEVATELGEGRVDPLLRLHPVGLELEEVVPGPEDVLVLADRVAGPVHVARADQAGDVPAEARRQADQALAVLAQDLPVDPRIVIEAVEVAVADQALEVAVADLVLGQEHQVVVLAVGLGRRVAVGDVGLAAEDRLDPVGLGRLVELDGAEHVAVVGHRHGLHPPLRDLRAQVRHPDGAVEQAVLGVQVQVREVADARGVARLVGGHGRRVPPGRPREHPAGPA